MTLKIVCDIPPEIDSALRQRRGKYTDMETVFHCLRVGDSHWLGVAGDGNNGSYEWFSMPSTLEFRTSDVGYGDTCIALREILNQEAI